MPENRSVTTLSRILYEPFVRRVLEEDFGRAGDITTDATIPENVQAEARIVTRAHGCIAGLEIATLAFYLLDPRAEIEFHHHDGDEVQAGDTLAVIRGSARVILQGERTALNILGHLSGISSATFDIVQSIRHTKARVTCTRKTTPGLRILEKYAVRVAGGSNHRFGLDDAVLIKENHLAVAGSIEEAVTRARRSVGHLVKIELEVETLEQLKIALTQPIDAVLLDNMNLDQVREAVALVNGKIITEVSGGIKPERAKALAETGVSLLSVGWLTHSAPSLDVALDIHTTSPGE